MIVVLLLAWVVICGAAFWFLFGGQVDPEAKNAIPLLQALVWPFTVVLIAVPLLLLLVFGGIDAVKQLVTLQTMIKSFPDDIEKMQAAAELFGSIKGDISTVREQLVAELATMRGQLVTDITLANSEAAQSAPPEAPTADGTEREKPEHIKRFEDMYDLAKRRFESALRLYNSKPSNETISVGRGESWHVPAEKLRDSKGGYYDTGPNKDKWIGDWVVDVLRTERNTRYNRESLLTPAVVSDLHKRQSDLNV